MKFAYFFMYQFDEEIKYFDSMEDAVSSARAAYEHLSKPDQRTVQWLYCADVPDDFEERRYSGKYWDHGRHYCRDILSEIKETMKMSKSYAEKLTIFTTPIKSGEKTYKFLKTKYDGNYYDVILKSRYRVNLDNYILKNAVFVIDVKEKYPKMVIEDYDGIIVTLYDAETKTKHEGVIVCKKN